MMMWDFNVPYITWHKLTEEEHHEAPRLVNEPPREIDGDFVREDPGDRHPEDVRSDRDRQVAEQHGSQYRGHDQHRQRRFFVRDEQHALCCNG